MQTSLYNANIPNEYDVLHALPFNFKVDDQDNIEDPLGMNAARLEVETHIITTQKSNLNNLKKAVRGAGVEVENMQAGDTIEVKVYHRLSDGGGLQLFAFYTWTGADGGLDNSEKIDQIDLYPNRHGFRITLDQTGGVNRDYPWELFIGV